MARKIKVKSSRDKSRNLLEEVGAINEYSFIAQWMYTFLLLHVKYLQWKYVQDYGFGHMVNGTYYLFHMDHMAIPCVDQRVD